MVKVVCFVGFSDSGKTTLLERIVPVLRKRGRRVAVIKHAHHGLNLDRPGTDTDRLWTAGAEIVIGGGPGETVVRRRTDGDPPLESLLAQLDSGIDIVLVEGFKESRYPKVAVVREGQSLSVSGVVAVVGEGAVDSPAPRFASDDMEGLADLVERMPPLGGLEDGEGEVTLSVNGRTIPLSRFPRSVMQGAVLGLISALRGIPDTVHSLRLEVRPVARGTREGEPPPDVQGPPRR